MRLSYSSRTKETADTADCIRRSELMASRLVFYAFRDCRLPPVPAVYFCARKPKGRPNKERAVKGHRLRTSLSSRSILSEKQ